MRLTSAGGCSFWPTPTAADAGYFPDLVVKDGQLSMTGPASIPKESGGQFSLNNAARNWTVLWTVLTAFGWSPRLARPPSSLPARVTFAHGKGSSSEGLISNPLFYELTMGWPIGWTDAAAPVTGWCRWLQRSRGELSAVLSAFNAEPDG